MARCLGCGQDGADARRKISPILPGWPKGWGEPDQQLGDFHAGCYQDWYLGMYHALAELDRSVNECADFERDPDDPTSGWLVVDGERYECRSWWRGDEVETLYPKLKEYDWWRSRRVTKAEG